MTYSSPILSVPIIRHTGLQSPVSRHFGKSPFHALIDPASRKIIAWVEKPAAKDTCAPIEELSKAGVTNVACVGLGKGALARMQNAGISVFHTTGNTLEEVITQWNNGVCSEITPEHLCAGHEHDHDHAHP
ncbi:NifB/NifX family molybdenum-iron cluster-binding protein [Kiritimatiellaeota bacterium B1221]|nr:NifB/NifX family molybdenum-iron cluster-binding protein [Kiritimatiellaeota bacterium B1221]